MNDRVRQLVAALDDERVDAAEDAQFELIEVHRAEALDPLLRAAPAFGRYGRLCAIEVFGAIGAPRATAVLIPWLLDDDDTVRDWSARALGGLGTVEAVPALIDAWERAKASGTPPDCPEPVSIRWALTELGAREVVMPEPVARHRVDAGLVGDAWPPGVLVDVLECLADARQVVAYFQFWASRPEDESARWYALTESSSRHELDWGRPWDVLVAEARREGVAHARAEVPLLPATTVATIEWLDESDVRPRPRGPQTASPTASPPS